MHRVKCPGTHSNLHYGLDTSNYRRATRRHLSSEDKIRIVLEGLRGEDSIAELCRREGIVQNLYYRWSKDFLEAGKEQQWLPCGHDHST